MWNHTCARQPKSQGRKGNPAQNLERTFPVPGDKLLKIQTVCQQLTEDLMTLSDDFVAEQRLSGWMTQQNTGAKAAAKNFCLPILAANVKGKNHTLAKIKISIHKFCFCCVICRTKDRSMLWLPFRTKHGGTFWSDARIRSTISFVCYCTIRVKSQRLLEPAFHLDLLPLWILSLRHTSSFAPDGQKSQLLPTLGGSDTWST